MARLVSPPTLSRYAASVSKTAKPATRLSVSRRAPIQSAASCSRKSAARPSPICSAASSTTLRAAPKALQHTRSTRPVSAITSRTTSGACIRALRESTAEHKKTANREQTMLHAQTRIPEPNPMPEEAARWTKLRRFETKIKKAVVEKMVNDMKEMKAIKDTEEKMTPAEEKVALAAELYEESEDTMNPSDDGDTILDNNPELLHDVSFDDTIEKHQQSSCLSRVVKWELLMDTARTRGRIAPCPRYHGHPLVNRRRKLPLPSKIPRRTKPNEKVEATPTKSPIEPPKAPKPISKRLAIKPQPKLDSARKPVARPKSKIVKPAKTRSQSPLSIQGPMKSNIVKSITLKTAKSKDYEPRPDSAIDIADTTKESDTPISAPVLAPTHKVVRFLEDPMQPLLFDRKAPAANVKSPLDMTAGLTPLKLNIPYPCSSQAIGFKTMFELTSTQCVGLKRRVLHRFKAVQEYEKRRKQESIAAGEVPTLGQLEYGNMDYKVNLQANKVITAHDIGSFVDPSDLGIRMTTYSGPLLHFGGVQDEHGRSFQDAPIPHTTTAAYKKPIGWAKSLSQASLDKWVHLQFAVMQHADLEG